MPQIEFSLKTEYIELFKLLKLMGLCESGGFAKQVIAGSQVKVNGVIETRKAFKVRPGQRIEFDGQVIVTT
ncbi:MAG: RNA-binding S4 domain-containing protein [Candidatus Omnitrophota bacterium]|nr:RNA-binding S4 domain-containing protein [Candidatus Omnitrophota bacterium]